MVNAFQEQALSTRLGIPIIYGIDAVHGHGNVFGATVFPHNIGLGATRDPALVEQVGQATAEEVRATGIPWNFAPCICVARDERWGRTYESFGEDPRAGVRMETIIDGLQGHGRAPITRRPRARHREALRRRRRHRVRLRGRRANEGQPWYEQRYTIDQGITVTSRHEFEKIDLAPYATRDQAARRRAASCRRSPASTGSRTGWATRSRCTRNEELITDVLKGQYQVRRLRHLGLGGHPPDPRPGRPGQRWADPVQGASRRERRHRHVHGAEQRAAVRGAAARRGERRPGQPMARIDDAVSRILAGSSSSGSSSTRSPRRTTSTRSAARRTVRSPGRPWRSRRCC